MQKKKNSPHQNIFDVISGDICLCWIFNNQIQPKTEIVLKFGASEK